MKRIDFKPWWAFLKVSTLVLLIGCTKETITPSDPIVIDCNCGTITEAKHFQNPTMGNWYYEFEIVNDCNGTDTTYYGTHEEWKALEVGDNHCLIKW